MKHLTLILCTAAVTASLTADVPVYNPASLVSGQQYLVAGWNFNDVSNPPVSQFAVSHGNGELTTNWNEENTGDFVGSGINSFSGDPNGRDIAFQNGGTTGEPANAGNWVQFAFTTEHLADVQISYAGRTTGTGMRDLTWSWSVDGENFTDFATVDHFDMFGGANYGHVELSLSGIAALNEQPEVFIRGTFHVLDGQSNPTSAGNTRFDNIQLRGTATTGVVSDGAGTATLRNAGFGTYHDTPAFSPAATETIEIVATGISQDQPLRAISFTLPDFFTGLSSGNVSASGSGFSGASVSVSGNTVTVANTELTDFASGTLTISGITMPDVENYPDFGSFEVAVATAVAGGELTPIAASPGGALIVPIEMLREVDENGVPLSLGRIVAVTGVMAVENFVMSSTQYFVFLQDETAGVAVFNPAITDFWDWGYRGAKITAIGPVAVFRGLTEIAVPDQDHLINLGPGDLPEPKSVTIAQILADAEALEGSLIRVRGVEKVSGDWPAQGGNATNITITDRTGAEMTFRITAQTDVSDNPEPEWPVDIVGVLTQFAQSNPPFSGGYQLISREYADITPAEPIDLEGFELWQDDHFAGLGPEVRAPHASPAGDDIGNLVKYALDLDPWTASRDLLPQPVVADDRLAIAFTRLRDATDIVYSVEAGSDLGNLEEIWSSDDHPYDSTEAAILETVSDIVALADAGKRFLRLVIRLK